MLIFFLGKEIRLENLKLMQKGGIQSIDVGEFTFLGIKLLTTKP